MHRRSLGLLVALTLAVPTVTAIATLPPFNATPASAVGFNFLCSPPGSGGSGGSSEFSLLANGLAESIFKSAVLWDFVGTVPPGVPVTGASTTDPVTHETTFTRPIAPRLGANQGIDFLDGAVVPGAAGNDFTVGLNFRSLAGQRSGPTTMLSLLSQNFGLPFDPGSTDIAVTGLDLNYATDTAVSHMHGFKGALQAAYAYNLANGTTNIAVATFRFDASGPGALIPDSGALSFAFRKPADNSSTHWVFEQDSVRNDFNGTTNQAGVGYGFQLDRLVNNVQDPLLSADIAWNAAPQSVAIGLGDLCPDESHFAWNMIGLPQPSLASVTATVKSGIGEGRLVQVNLPSGPVMTQTDAFGLQGSVTKLPKLMDVILRRDEMSFTRSNDVAPDIDLTRLAMADNDPAHPQSLPLFATAHGSSLPRHILVTATEDPTTGAFNHAELTSWVLSCPGEPAPPGPAAPTDVRRLDLPLTLPGFPVGCVRWSLTPIPSIQVVVQNWLPEDLLGQAAAAGLATAPLSANQFGYFATRTHNTLSTEALLAFGVKINGLQRATLDLTGASPGGSRARFYVERAPVVAADDSAQLMADLDNTTTSSELTNQGSRLTGSATITDVPNTIRLDVQDTPLSPFDLTWRADGPIAITNGVADALFAGPTALTVHAAFETGAVSAGALPPAAHLGIVDAPNNAGGSVLWNNPGAATDTFPTPTVPAFDPTTITRVHAGAEISTLAERQNNLATRAHVDLSIPQPSSVTWTQGADGTVSSVVGSFCDPALTAACANTRFDGTVAHTTRSSTTPAALLTPPTLPGPDGTIQNTAPPFTTFRPNSGARAVVFSPTSWGADVLIHGVARVAYNQAPENYEVQLANTSPQSFAVQVLDSSKIVHASNGFDRPQVVFSDAVIDKLPQQIRVQLSDGSNNQPIAWVNTENLAITDINSVNFNTTDAPGTRPLIRGVVRVGDAQILALGVNAASRPTPPRTAATKGIDVFAGFDADRGFFGIDGSFALDLPREVALYKPTDTSCTETNDPPVAIDTCQTSLGVTPKRSYEFDRTQSLGLKFRTTNQSLGDLGLNGFIGGTNLDLNLHGAIGNVPGQLDGNVLITSNQRLGWTTVSTSVTGNTALQSVIVEVADHSNPVSYESNSGTQATPQFGVVLTNVPKTLNVKTVLGGIEPRISDPAIAPTDPCSPSPSTEEHFGYAHTQLDLAGTDAVGHADLELDVREVDGQTSAAFKSNEPISGFINARLDHLKVSVHSSCGGSTTQRIETAALGIGITGVGALGGALLGAAIGSGGGPIGAIIGGIVGALIAFFLDLFSSPSVTVDFDFEADVPFFVGFDKVKEVDVGVDALTLSVLQDQPNGGDPLHVGFRQQSMSDESSFTADGAWFESRKTSYVGDDIPLADDWNFHNSDSGLQTVGVYDKDLCDQQSEDNPCYSPGNDNIASVSGSSGYFVMDPFFDPSNRSDMKSHESNSASISPGTTLYRKLADAGATLTHDAFTFSDIANTNAQSSTFTLESNCCADAHIDVLGTNVDLGNQGAVCEYPTALGTPAVANDSTEYTVSAGGTTDAVTSDQHRSLCSDTTFALQARLPAVNGIQPARWSVALPTPSGLEGNGACQQDSVRCEFTYTVSPQTDGSVQVTESTSVITNGVDESSLVYTLDPDLSKIGIDLYRNCCGAPSTQTGDTPSDGGSTHALVDASGHPGNWQTGDAAVDDFSTTTNGVSVVDANASKFSIDPCAVASFACTPADGEHVLVLYGDGTVATFDGAAGVQTHVYPKYSMSQSYLGEVLLTGPDCGTDKNRACNLEAKAYFTVTN